MNGRTHANPALVLWLVHLSFIIAVPIYAGLMFVLIQPDMASPRGGGGIPRPLLLAVLATLSVIQVAFALGIGRWLRADEAQSGGDGAVNGAPAANYLRRRTTQTVIADALIEAVAIYGLIGFFLGLTAAQALAFMTVALVLLLARIAQLRSWTDEYHRIRQS